MPTSRFTPASPAVRAVLAQNLASVQARIAAATAAAGRSAPPQLVAVTKTVGPAVTSALVDLGCAGVAENRADAFVTKWEAVGAPEGPDRARADVRWHFIGHLQRNKARRVLEHCDVLHSVDSARLAEAVVRLTGELERDVEVFLEVNLTGEAEKHGFDPERSDAEISAALGTLAAAPRVRVAGLMAMGPLGERPGSRSVDDVFGATAALGRDLEARFPNAFDGGRCRLSMGMSGDLEAAVRHGSDLVRVGSALFEGLGRREASA